MASLDLFVLFGHDCSCLMLKHHMITEYRGRKGISNNL